MYAVHRDDAGTADAYAVYWTKHDWPRSVPSGTITVHECVASTPAGNADIWRFLFDVDLVATVEAWNRPADEPLLHLLREHELPGVPVVKGDRLVGIVTEADLVLESDDSSLHLPHYFELFGGLVFLPKSLEHFE